MNELEILLARTRHLLVVLNTITAKQKLEARLWREKVDYTAPAQSSPPCEVE
jgi:hypothetical protein